MGRSEWAFSHRPVKDSPEVQKMLNDWEYRLKLFLHYSPKRSDLAVPYLIWRMNQNQDLKVAQFAKGMIASNATDPVGLWFLGITQLQDENSAKQGAYHMRLALKLGIKEIMPIDLETIQQINEVVQ